MQIILKEIEELREDLKAHQQQLAAIFPKHNEILTYEQTMELLKCSRNFLDGLRKEGIVKVYRLKGRLYCKYSELLEAMDAQLINVKESKRKGISNPSRMKKPASLA